MKKQMASGKWKLSSGEEVEEHELLPIHELDDTMQYILVIEPCHNGDF